VRKEKTDLESQVTTKTGQRYKTSAEVQLKDMRRTLAEVRSAVLKMQTALQAAYGDGSEADDISQRFSAAIVGAIDRLV
jgi:hypothetical protein